jgi:hypothetical protein
MIIGENHSPFPHLQALCAERGIEKHSLSQVFQDLGIQFDLEGNDVLNIRLNRTVWPGRYLERGFLTAEIEVFEPKIKSWLKSGLSFGKTGEEGDQDIPVKDARPKPATNPTEPSDPIRYSLEALSSSVFPLEWQTLLTRLLTREKPSSLRQGEWNGVFYQVHLWLGKDKEQFQKIIHKGWTPRDVFGCHGKKPRNRYDCMGLILLLEDKTIQSVTHEFIEIKTPSGAIQTYYKPKPLYVPSDKITLDLLT